MIKLKRPQPGDRLNDLRILLQIFDAVEELQRQHPGPGLGKTPGGILYAVNPERREVEGNGENGDFFAVITEINIVTAKVQWSYDFVEIYKDDLNGYSGTWHTLSGGRTGIAFNLTEFINTDDGLCGNGVDAGALAIEFPGFEIQPCPVGNPICVHTNHIPDGGDEYWFEYQNGIDGSCV